MSTTAPSVKCKESDGEDPGDEGWRVLLLRALVIGDVELMERVLGDHIEVLSLPFSTKVPQWKIQWESLYWWMLRDATPLFVAAAYSHPELVQGLLLRGADRESKCYLNQAPLHFVGECCETAMAMVPTVSNASVLERSAACRRLLTSPPAPPAPPTEGVEISCHISSQVVAFKMPPASPSMPLSGQSTSGDKSTRTAQFTQQTVFKCLAELVWETPMSNGALIEKYEARHRQMAKDGDTDTGESGAGSWRIERVAHNRKVKLQRLVIESLQFDCAYEFMLRSWNAAGNGDWGRVYKLRTPASPEPVSGPSRA